MSDETNSTRDLDSILEDLKTETADLQEKIAANEAEAEQAKVAHEEASKDLESALSRLRSVGR